MNKNFAKLAMSRPWPREAARAVFAAMLLAGLPATVAAGDNSMGPSYPVTSTAALVSDLSASPYVFPTTTATGYDYGGPSVPDTGKEALVVYKTSFSTGLGIPAQDVYGFHITDTTFTGPKQKVVVIGGVHAREQAGSWELDYFLRELVKDNPEMAALRKKADIYVYPQVNPEGRYAYDQTNPNNPLNVQRGDPQHTGDSYDFNRVWNNPTGWKQIVAIQPIMRTDTGGDVDYFLDFHARSFTPGNNGVPASGKELKYDAEGAAFYNNAKARDPGIMTYTATNDPAMATEWAKSVGGLNADFSYDPEVARDHPTGFYQFSTVYAYALNDTIPTPLPEPSTWAMLLAGLGALGLPAWRRRRAG